MRKLRLKEERSSANTIYKDSDSSLLIPNLNSNVMLPPLRAEKLKFVFNRELLIPYWL